MKKIRKNDALKLLKKILTALHEEKFEDAVRLVDECSMGADEIQEFVQGTVTDNGYERIDKYMEDNICAMDGEGDDPFLVETYLTADEGFDLSLCLSLELETDEDGKIRSRLDIQPN